MIQFSYVPMRTISKYHPRQSLFAKDETSTSCPFARATAAISASGSTARIFAPASLSCEARIPVPEPTSRMRGALASGDRKSTRLNSSHVSISYAVFCLKKKNEHGEDSNEHHNT